MRHVRRMSAFSTATARSAQDVWWASAGQAINVIVALASLKVWASYLLPADLGLMGLLIGAASVLVGVVVGPLTQATFVSYAAYSRDGKGREFRTASAGAIFGCAAACAGAIVVIGTAVSVHLGLHWSTPLLVAGLFTVDAQTSFERMLLAAARRQREVATIAVGDAWLRFVFVWLLLSAFEPTGYTAVLGNLLGGIAWLLVMRGAMKLEAYPGEKSIDDGLRRRICEELVRIARPLFPSGVLANLSEAGTRYIIAAMIGLQPAGVFVMGYGLVRRPFGMVFDVAYVTMTPALSEAIARRSLTDVRRTQRTWMAFVALSSITGAGLFHVLREPLVMLLLSEQYQSVADLLFGMAITVAIYNLCGVINGFLITRGDSRAALANNLVGAIAGLSLTIALCPLFGLVGAVWALGIGFTTQLFSSIITLRASDRRQQGNSNGHPNEARRFRLGAWSCPDPEGG